MCRPTCTTPDFYSLPRIPNLPAKENLRSVHGMWMTEEEYRVSGWHSRGTYVSGRGVTEHLWIAPLGGLMEWSRREWQRREAGFQRRQADNEWSDNVVAMIEERLPRG